MSVVYKRKLSRLKSFSHIYSLDTPICRKRYLYHYISIKHAITMFSKTTNNLRFVEPSIWTDSFEKRFYTADYNTLLHASADAYPRLYAFCNTIQKDSVPSWKMYSSGSEKTIQLKINRSNWLKELNRIATQYECFVYEGLVSYELSEAHLAILHQANYSRGSKIYPVSGHDKLFSKFDLTSYLSLLLFKRDAYKWEDEIRYFLIPNSVEESELFISIDWNEVIEEVRVHPNIGFTELNKLSTALATYIPNCKIAYYDINNGIYTNCNTPIVIEK